MAALIVVSAACGGGGNADKSPKWLTVSTGGVKYQWVATSPDQKTIAFASPAGVGLLDVSTLKTHTLHADSPSELVRSPFYFADGRLGVLVSSTTSLSKSSLAFLNDDGSLSSIQTSVSPVQASAVPDGSGVVVQVDDTQSDLYLQPLDGHDATPILVGPESDESPAVSPDGKRVAFVRSPDGSSPATELWVVGIDGSDPRRLMTTADPYGRLGDPAWSPDGTRLAVSSDEVPDSSGLSFSQFFVVKADGSGEPVQISHGYGNKSETTWVGDHLVAGIFTGYNEHDGQVGEYDAG